MSNSSAPLSNSMSTSMSDSDFFGQYFKERKASSDGWEGTEQVASKYKATEFIIPASDSKGRSSRLQCKITPQFSRLVTEAVSCRRFGFRTESDVVRWCVQHGLRFLKELEPGYAPFMMRALAEVELLRDFQLRAATGEIIGELERSVKMCTDAGEWVEAKRVVKNTLDRFYNSEDDIWRSRIIGLIREKFRHVIEYQTI